MRNETARREIESLDYYLQNHTNDYSEESHTAMMMAIKALEQEPKTGHCKDCKHFRKLPYHADTLGKCFQHTGLCPKGDWYCADYEPQERGEV